MTDSAGPALVIGAVLGDSDTESMLWSRAIGALSQTAESLSAHLQSPLRVNVVYHVDGRLARNEFEGVRTGRFNKAKDLLVVQAATPGGPSDARRETLINLLSDAVTEAEKYAKKKNIADSLPVIRELVLKLHGM